ncbi:hypothetical protein GCM10009827_077580 [Dactylosporangium maewongense]|uniref:Uncharacterized protein n=1 Tax=Dactylosporangium maewongense TaxID=634393 RepID=A0ABN2BTT4_9ACTN
MPARHAHTAIAIGTSRTGRNQRLSASSGMAPMVAMPAATASDALRRNLTLGRVVRVVTRTSLAPFVELLLVGGSGHTGAVGEQDRDGRLSPGTALRVTLGAVFVEIATSRRAGGRGCLEARI